MSFFGPILRYELVRIARRQRLTLVRCLYAVALVGVAVVTYATVTRGGEYTPRPSELARATEWLFYGLFAGQFLILALKAPQWAADAVTGERERRTLPFLLMTDLRSREIVLGKLAARLAQPLVLVLAGLPVLCFLQLFGGVEPVLVAVGYAALFATLASVCAVSLLCSVYAPTTRVAMQRFGRVIGLYVVFLMAGGNVLRFWPGVAAFPGTPTRPGLVSVQDVYDLLDAGNPFAAAQQIAGGVSAGGRFDDAVWPAAGPYLLFHLAVAAACGTWAVWRLRPAAAALGDGPPPPVQRGLRQAPPRPPVSARPVLWKSLHFDFRQYHTHIGRVFTRLVFLLSFSPLVVTIVISLTMGSRGDLALSLNVLLRSVVTAALCGMLLIIAAQASNCIDRERRKQTLDDLLLTDLSANEILAQKWWGSVLAIRWGLAWVVIHWAVGLIGGGLHPLAVPALAVEWSAYAACAASLGVYWAVRMPTGRAAGIGTGLIGFGLVVVPIVAGVLIAQMKGDADVAVFGATSLSPPVALGLSAFRWEDFTQLRKLGPRAVPVVITATATGVVVSGLLAWRLWRGACWWFPRRVRG
jgi:ABC-type transport system involved in multi-copper enzyme maturation permease subunit